MHKNWMKPKFYQCLQRMTAVGCGLALTVAMQGCAADGAAHVDAEDEALKGGIPANSHGKGRPGAGVAGAGGAVDADDQDASVDDECAREAETRGKPAMPGKGKSTTGSDQAAKKQKCRGVRDRTLPAPSGKGRSGTQGNGKAAAHGKRAPTSSDAGAAADDDESAGEDDDQDSDEQA